MTAGKTASQAGHAVLDSYLKSQLLRPELAKEYNTEHHGIKVCLACPSLDELLEAQARAEAKGLPTALIYDLGYTCFEGQTTITALGIGPVYKDEVKNITGKYKLL